jgi:hypothetical protein
MATSPSREQCSPRTNEKENIVVSSSLETTGEGCDVTNKSVTTDESPTPVISSEATKDVEQPEEEEKSSIPADMTPVIQHEDPPEPPRRRYQRRSSATAYNLHNYAEQAQSCQGEMTPSM